MEYILQFERNYSSVHGAVVVVVHLSACKFLLYYMAVVITKDLSDSKSTRPTMRRLECRNCIVFDAG